MVLRKKNVLTDFDKIIKIFFAIAPSSTTKSVILVEGVVINMCRSFLVIVDIWQSNLAVCNFPPYPFFGQLHCLNLLFVFTLKMHQNNYF